MPGIISRRNFVKTSAAAALVAGTKSVLAGETDNSGKKQEYYELRAYRANNADKQKLVANYLEKALIPALGRMGIDRIGVFTNLNIEDDYSVYLIIPYANLELFSAVNPNLLKDKEYQNASKDHFAALKDDPVFTRIQSRFYKAFKEIPVIELPVDPKKVSTRIFELRIYESHTEEKAALKVDMFNSGEIQIMRDTDLGPVFFGEALIGDDLPNLTYMLSAENPEAHEIHWQKFRDHPEWEKMTKIEKYKGTVSNITVIFLKPTEYSQI